MAINFIVGDVVVVRQSYVNNTLTGGANTTVLQQSLQSLGQLSNVPCTVTATGAITIGAVFYSFIKVLPTKLSNPAFHGGAGVGIFFLTDTLLNNSFELSTSFFTDVLAVASLNNSGVAITKGQVVRYTGFSAGFQLSTVALASAAALATSAVMGIAEEDIANGAIGSILIEGAYQGILTTGTAVNDVVYLSDTAGAIAFAPGTITSVVGRVHTVGAGGMISVRGEHPFGIGGVAGATGVLGTTGIQGVTGVCCGITGMIGATGIKGETGIQGDTGILGLTGLALGSTGLQGPTGLQGDTGIQGNTGVQGVTGVIGVTGLIGDTGIQGVTGVIGATGVQGVTGVIGATGLTGETGIQGITGLALGATGLTGPTGLIGATGLQGDTGIAGGTGIQGVTGLIGDTGIQGVTGLIGDTGIQGVTGVVGVTGLIGATGVQGVTGLVGDTGIQGVTGLLGLTGLALGSTGLQGPTGVQGDTGIQGLTGLLGLTGLALGATGIQGVTGFVGATGIQGLTGLQGDVATLSVQTSTSSSTLTYAVPANTLLNVGDYLQFWASVQRQVGQAITVTFGGQTLFNNTPASGAQGELSGFIIRKTNTTEECIVTLDGLGNPDPTRTAATVTLSAGQSLTVTTGIAAIVYFLVVQRG